MSNYINMPKRLTKDNYQDDCFRLQDTVRRKLDFGSVGYCQGNYNDDLWNKVKQIEDIEEELGCPIDIIFRALKNGVYIKLCFENEPKLYSIMLEDMEEFTFDYIDHNGQEEVGSRSFKEYGKTWALTKEELI